MRLITAEIRAIKECSAKFFPNSKIYLFGSSVNDVLINNGSENKLIFKTAKQTGVIIMNKYQDNLENTLLECKKHTVRIISASEKMQNFMPLTAKKYQALNDEKIMAMDQFLFRFAKLQDTIGAKLFATLLLFLGEDIQSKTIIDRLNRLEQLNLIQSKIAWQELRNIRNDLSCQYEQDSIKSLEFINSIYQKQDELIRFYLKINQYYQKNYKQ